MAPARDAKKRKSEPDQSLATPTNSYPWHSIDVKTKFPVARIKRIMQADEDVGKVAQATPTAVCTWPLSADPARAPWHLFSRPHAVLTD
jgi:hypothetical protein